MNSISPIRLSYRSGGDAADPLAAGVMLVRWEDNDYVSQSIDSESLCDFAAALRSLATQLEEKEAGYPAKPA